MHFLFISCIMLFNRFQSTPIFLRHPRHRNPRRVQRLHLKTHTAKPRRFPRWRKTRKAISNSIWKVLSVRIVHTSNFMIRLISVWHDICCKWVKCESIDFNQRKIIWVPDVQRPANRLLLYVLFPFGTSRDDISKFVTSIFLNFIFF